MIFILLLLLYYYDAQIQAYEQSQGIYARHREYATRIGIAIVLIAMFFVRGFYAQLSFVAFASVLRWNVFDPLLNLLTKKGFFYIGTPETGKDDSTMDTLLAKLPYPEYTQFIPKLILLYITYKVADCFQDFTLYFK